MTYGVWCFYFYFMIISLTIALTLQRGRPMNPDVLVLSSYVIAAVQIQDINFR